MDNKGGYRKKNQFSNLKWEKKETILVRSTSHCEFLERV